MTNYVYIAASLDGFIADSDGSLDWLYATSSLQTVPPEPAGKVELASGDVAAIAQDLRSRGYVNLYIDGGRTIQGFLKADLIDELVLTTVPVLLGGGAPLFGDIGRKLAFRHESTAMLTPQLMKTRYVRDRTASPG